MVRKFSYITSSHQLWISWRLECKGNLKVTAQGEQFHLLQWVPGHYEKSSRCNLFSRTHTPLKQPVLADCVSKPKACTFFCRLPQLQNIIQSFGFLLSCSRAKCWHILKLMYSITRKQPRQLPKISGRIFPSFIFEQNMKTCVQSRKWESRITKDCILFPINK